MTRVSITVDFEPDCPPYLSSTFRGIEEGAPALLELFADAGVCATYFTTGEVAQRFPDAVRALVANGHELGCHGVTHSAFDTLSEPVARWEITRSAEILRHFAPVTSFRAPYLRLPERYVPLLEESEFLVDSSLAKYKRSYYFPRASTTLTRIAASTMPSVLRLPRILRTPMLLTLSDPVVLFVHPWEFVDLTRENLPFDCRFRTGEFALRALREVIEFYRARGAEFIPIAEIAPRSRAA